MRPRPNNPSIRLLVLLALFSLVIFYLAEGTLQKKPAPHWELKNRAAILDQRAQDVIREEVKKLGIAIDYENDPNGTGLIGEQNTLITTDVGELRSKLAATNPNFAAVFVQMLKDANVKRGDKIAVCMSGSFPGANIALFSACQVMGIEPVVITSLGSSTWGANSPALTWIDMERLLYNEKIFSFHSVAASFGGGNDNGRGLSVKGRMLLHESIKRDNMPLIFSGNLDSLFQSGGTLRQNIDKRMEIFDQYKKGIEYAAYVNIGGGLASLGSSQNGRLIPSGVNFDLFNKNFPVRGIINMMAERKIPVIHVLRLTEIAHQYGLSRDIVPAPIVGEDKIFFKDEYSIVLTTIYAFVLIAFVVIAIRFDVKYYIKKQTRVFFPPRKEEDPEM